MPSSVTQFVRRYVRGLRRADNYPVLLPHFTLTDEGTRDVAGLLRPLPRPLLNALRLCDGSRTLAEVARESGASKFQIMQLHDRGEIILWSEPLHAQEVNDDGRNVTSVIVSPHLDDAVLSAYSCLSSPPGNVRDCPLVLDVFSRSAWWRFRAGAADPERVQRTREQEERLVARLTGCRLRMLHLPEALLRGYPFEEVFQAPVHERDREVRASLGELATAVAREHARAHWFLPLGIGNHVDHVITRDETLAALERQGTPSARISFYEDLPYAAELSGVPDLSQAIPGRRLRACAALAVGEDKLECLRVYWSQLVWSQIVKVRAYGKRIGGGKVAERTWQLAS